MARKSASVSIAGTPLEKPRNIKRVFHGVSIVIEYKEGDVKPSKEDPTWGWTQRADYGFIPGTTSNEEGEGLDVFIGPNPESERVFLSALLDPETCTNFMEYKVLLGFDSHKEAHQFACRQYFDGMVALTYEMTLNELKEWIELQEPMAEKLEMRLTEEEAAEQVKIEERQREPALEIYADS